MGVLLEAGTLTPDSQLFAVLSGFLNCCWILYWPLSYRATTLEQFRLGCSQSMILEPHSTLFKISSTVWTRCVSQVFCIPVSFLCEGKIMIMLTPEEFPEDPGS